MTKSLAKEMVRITAEARTKFNTGTPGDYYDAKGYERRELLKLKSEGGWTDKESRQLDHALDLASYVGD